MFKVVVFNLKNIIKNFIKFIAIILLFVGIRNILNLSKQGFSNINYKKIINKNMYFLNEIKVNKNQDILDIAFLTSTKVVSNNTISQELNKSSIEENFAEVENINLKEEILKDNVENNKKENKEYVTEFNKVETKVINDNNIKENYNITYDTVKIKNESKYMLTNEMLTPNIDFSNKKNILIFHTHTCESYTPTEKFSYIASGNFRTIDTNYSVARVGSELTNYLNNKGFSVQHLLGLHDYPAYNGSYNRSYSTVNNALKNNSSSLVIDLHRDAVGSSSNYAPSVLIGEEKVAQLMFVIGTNGGGLSHDNWNTNLKLAIKIQQKANEMYPGLFRPIIVRNSRYNQNLAEAACIIEVGATGNTLEEAMGSMKYLSNILEAVMK